MKRRFNYLPKTSLKHKNFQELVYPKDMDEEMVPLSNVLNSIPGCRTLYTCCGHSHEGWYVVLKFTSDVAHEEVRKAFEKNGAHDILDNSGAGHDDPIPEVEMTVYWNSLGLLPDSKRFKAYKSLCNDLVKLLPASHW